MKNGYVDTCIYRINETLKYLKVHQFEHTIYSGFFGTDGYNALERANIQQSNEDVESLKKIRNQIDSIIKKYEQSFEEQTP